MSILGSAVVGRIPRYMLPLMHWATHAYAKREVISEWLFRIMPSGKEFCIFSRDVHDGKANSVETDINFNDVQEADRLKIYFEDFGVNISEDLRKKMMLSDIATRSGGKKGIFKEIYSVYEWFKRLLIIFPNSKYGLLNDLGRDVERKESFQKLMNYFDTGIESVESQSKSIDFDKILTEMPCDQAEKLKVDLYSQNDNSGIPLIVGRQMIVLRKDEMGNLVYNKLFKLPTQKILTAH